MLSISTFLILFLVLLVAYATGYELTRKVARLKDSKIVPGPKRVPLLGNALEMFVNRSRLLDWIMDQQKKYGSTFTLDIPHLSYTLAPLEPECAEHILKTNFANYPKGPVFGSLLSDLLGNGIFVADGENWKEQRKTFSHLFKTSNLKTFMYATFLKHGYHALTILEDFAKRKEELNTIDLFYRYTLDSIGEIAFGKNIGSLDTPAPASTAFDLALNHLEQRVSQPFFKLIPDPKLHKAIKVLDDFAYALIQERRKDPELPQKEDLLSQYIQNTNESDVYLRDVIMNFLIAGRDTTGQTLQWMFYLLSQNPAVQEKLVQEIDTVLGGSEPTYERLKEMKYLEGVVNETLRLYPPVPVDFKCALEDDVLPNGTSVPKGSYVMWSAWCMGRNEKYWPNPLEMKPERWISENEQRHPFLFIPFQAGPRICLGMTMALMEVKLMSVLILQKFYLTLSPGQIVQPIFNITLSSKYGMKMAVHSRKPSS